MSPDSLHRLNSIAHSPNTRSRKEVNYRVLERVNIAFEGKTPVNELSPEEQQAHAKMLCLAQEDLDGSDVHAMQEIQRAGVASMGLTNKVRSKKGALSNS